jgi:hypothetical protein
MFKGIATFKQADKAEKESINDESIKTGTKQKVAGGLGKQESLGTLEREIVETETVFGEEGRTSRGISDLSRTD